MTDEEQQDFDNQHSGQHDERRRQKAEDLYDQKELAFYSQGVAAFFSTALELDKSFLTLSVAAIGFWVALIGVLKVELFISTFGVVFFGVSLLAFAVTTGLVLTIFHFNKGAILEFLNTPAGTIDPGPNNKKIKKLDGWVRYSFGIGVSSLMLFAMFTADRLLDHRSQTMTTENDKNRPSIYPTGLVIESFDKMQDLRPRRDVIKSFTGAEQLRPQPSSSSQGATQAPAPAPTTGASGPNNQNSTSSNTRKK